MEHGKVLFRSHVEVSNKCRLAANLHLATQPVSSEKVHLRPRLTRCETLTFWEVQNSTQPYTVRKSRQSLYGCGPRKKKKKGGEEEKEGKGREGRVQRHFFLATTVG